MLSNLSKPLTFLFVAVITLFLAVVVVFFVGPIQIWLAKLSLTWATIISIATLVVTIFWAWFRSKEFILLGSPDEKSWRDLRLWAIILMMVMIVIYLIF